MSLPWLLALPSASGSARESRPQRRMYIHTCAMTYAGLQSRAGLVWRGTTFAGRFATRPKAALESQLEPFSPMSKKPEFSGFLCV